MSQNCSIFFGGEINFDILCHLVVTHVTDESISQINEDRFKKQVWKCRFATMPSQSSMSLYIQGVFFIFYASLKSHISP